MKRWVVLLACVATVVLAAPAWAQYGVAPASCVQPKDPAGTPDVVFTPGDPIRVVGAAGCAAAQDSVTIQLASTPTTLGVITAGPDGSYDSASLGLRIPAGTEPGIHTLSAIPSSRRNSPYSITITIAAPASGTSGTRLPRTGRNLLITAIWGAAAVVVGFILMTGLLSYRRELRRLQSKDHEPVAAPLPVSPPLVDADTGRLPVLAFAGGSRHSQDSFEDVSHPEAYRPQSHPEQVPDAFERSAFTEPFGGFAEPAAVSEPAEKPAVQVRVSARDAAERTSELVAKLQSEIQAWSESARS